MHRRLFKAILKALPKAADAGASAAANPAMELQVATCALLLEIAHADSEFQPDEERTIERLMRAHFKLSTKDFHAIQRASEKERKGSVDLYRFARIIKEHYSYREKAGIVEMLWEIVYADDALHAHEDYLVHKLADVLSLDHGTLIEAKLKVLGRRKGA